MTLDDLQVEDTVCERARGAVEDVNVDGGTGGVGGGDGGDGRVFARGAGVDGEVRGERAGVGEDLAEG